jgi:RNA polymerase sigma-70 factor (ECF subfamily)
VENRLKRLSDTELALRAKEGAVSAFEEIYNRHASGIAKVLASYAGPDRDVLDDLTQDVFYRAIDGIASYVPSHPFTHWLYTIALNVGRNHVRRQSKVVVLDPNDFDSIAGNDGGTADWSEEIIEVTLIQLITHLPNHVREVISLRIGSDLSYGEIAEVLGIPEGTARSRMHTAVTTLRGKLGVKNSKKERK